MNVHEPQMIEIPAGRLVMGLPACPEEAGSVRRWHSGEEMHIREFKLGRFAVTNAEYKAFIRATGAAAPSHIGRAGFDADEQPVGAVSWEDAVAYCQWLGKATGKKYRLPTDGEWEYAARGGQAGKKYSTGDRLDAKDACFGGAPAPKPVGSFPPNGFGLYDMTGNIWQWCADRYEDVSKGIKATNKPTGKDPANNRVLRGGSYLTTNDLNLWVAYRHEDPPDLRHECIGFRVAI
jgi:formylglycine-generating enzyme required for sulfatase activity